MRAVWTRARSDLRRHLRVTVTVACLIGLWAAIGLACAAGAQRTDTAYARLRAAGDSPDAAIYSCSGGAAPLGEHVDVPTLVRLPEVETVRVETLFLGEAIGADGKELFFGAPNTDTAFVGAPTVEGQPAFIKILEGRLPDPNRADEVAVGYSPNALPPAMVGATIDLRLVRADITEEELIAGAVEPEEILGPPIPVTVVGRVFAANGTQLSGEDPGMGVTPAFVRQYRASSLTCEVVNVTLKNGPADTEAFQAGFSAAFPGANITLPHEEEAALVRRSARVQVVTLWLFFLFSTIAGFVIFGQALSRLSFTQSMENPILSALGMTRRQLFAVAMVRAAVVGALAGVVALVGSVAASSLFPTGLIQIVEPTPGTEIGLIVLAGALCVMLGVMLLSVFPALRGARTPGDARGVALVEEFGRPSAIAQMVTRSGLPASVTTGVRLALEPGRGRTAVPVRSAIAGLTLGVAAVTVALGFEASLQHLGQTPRLYGNFMDFGGGYPFSGGFDDAIASMVDDPGLADVMVGNFREHVHVQGPAGSAVVNVWGMETVKGSITPVITEGTWPVTWGELALGAATMKQLGTHIGDTVQARSGDTVVPLEVVGKAVFGDFGFGPGLGQGAGMTFAQLQALFPDDERNLFLANLAPGANSEDVKGRLNPQFGPLGAPLQSIEEMTGTYMAGATITNLGRMKRVPMGLSVLLVVAGIGTLAHVLVTSIRRRGRDLAVLQALGFVRRQVSATVAWQATTLAGIALLIGLPLGVAVGRWMWTLFAHQVGVIAVPVVDVRSLVLAIPVTLILANLIAVIPGRLASATRPTEALRSE